MSTILATKITQFRKVSTQLRRLRVHGGTTAATTRAIGRHELDLAHLVHELDVLGHRLVSGDLADESNLLARLNLARHLGQDRPDLRERLTAVRRRIRAAR